MEKFYQEQAKKLPPPGPWAKEAMQHWKEFYPELHQQLSQSGELEIAARVAEANAKDYCAHVVSQGFDARGAEEQAKAMYIYGNPDPEPDEQDEAEGISNTMGAIHRMLLDGGRNLPVPPSAETTES